MMTRIKIRAKTKRIIVLTIMIAAMFSYIAVQRNDNDTYAASVPTATAQVNASSGAFVRAKASTSSSKVAKLSDNTKVKVNKEVFIKTTSTKATDRWYQITVSGKTGYIRADLLDTFSYSAVQGTTTDALNYRTGPSSKMTRKGTLKKGAGIDIVLKANLKGSSAYWYKIRIGSSYYYVNDDWVKLNSGATSTVAAAAVTTKAATTSTTTTKTTATSSSDTKTSTSSVKATFNNTGLTYPETLVEGMAFSLKGTISCDQIIDKVVFGVQDSGGSWVIREERTVGKDSYSVSAIDTSIKFGLLTPGSYSYVGQAYVDGKSYSVINKAFSVVKATGGDKLTNAALALAWPLGSSSSTTYSKKATTAFTAALNKYYPEHTKWSVGPKTGASCDVFIATLCRYTGLDSEMPRTLSKMWSHMASSSKWVKVNYSYKESELKSGDIFFYTTTAGSSHVCMYLKVNGKTYCAEASYPRKLHGFINTSTSKFFKSSNKKKLEVYRPAS